MGAKSRGEKKEEIGEYENIFYRTMKTIKNTRYFNDEIFVHRTYFARGKPGWYNAYKL